MAKYTLKDFVRPPKDPTFKLVTDRAEVPVLSADDMYTGGTYESPKNSTCRCLIGHTYSVFGCGAVSKPIVHRLAEYVLAFGESGSVYKFNDGLATKPLLAKVWNSVMEDFGYTEVSAVK